MDEFLQQTPQAGLHLPVILNGAEEQAVTRSAAQPCLHVHFVFAFCIIFTLYVVQILKEELDSPDMQEVHSGSKSRTHHYWFGKLKNPLWEITKLNFIPLFSPSSTTLNALLVQEECLSLNSHQLVYIFLEKHELSIAARLRFYFA